MTTTPPLFPLAARLPEPVVAGSPSRRRCHALRPSTGDIPHAHERDLSARASGRRQARLRAASATHVGPSRRGFGRGPLRPRLLILFVACLLAAGPLAAQTGPLFPDLRGSELTNALAAAYTPISTYSYDRARDTLFAAVHLERRADGTPTDSLRGFYSGHAIWLDPALDPSTAAWNASPRFSTEHLWPENRGATDGTDAHADLHHLAPVMQSVNSSRVDHPFGEIDDDDADRWWGPDGVTRTSAPPLATRDLYTEKLNAGTASRLEPREDRAGDVARAMFYVWTVYGPSGADQLDGAFWDTQRDVLLDWHAQDPADSTEIARTRAIEHHQGTANPYVLDSTLALRAFGPPPVQVALASFTAEQVPDGTGNGPGARIAWTTSVEMGIASFRVDGRPDVFGSPWTTWGTVAASGQPSAYTLDMAALSVGAYRVGLTAIDSDGVEQVLGDIGLTVEAPTADEADPAATPFALAPPAPNPSRGRTTATLTLHRSAHVLAVVYDALGREAAVVYDREAAASVEIPVDTTALAPGIYVLRVTVIGHGVAVDGSASVSRTFSVAGSLSSVR